jgi:glycosyltransferase involved in cell wall biosynthesis
MPKVLRILNRFNLGGPTYNAAYLTSYLSPEFETLLIGGEKDDAEESSLHITESLKIKPLLLSEMRRNITPVDDYKAYQKIKEIIRQYKPDIVHTHAAKAGFLGRLAAHQCKVPVIVHTFHGHVFHSYFGSLQTNIFKNLERYAARISDGIIAISQKQKQELSEVYKICKPDKIKVIPLGFDLEKFTTGKEQKRKSFRTAYCVSDDEIAIGIVGRLTGVKNHKFFIDAIARLLKQTDKKVRAFIVGDGEEKDNLKQYCREINLSYTEYKEDPVITPITFTSWIKDVDWVNAGIDVMALTSLNEGTPVSLIEAQAASLPIVTTAVGGIEDVVIPNETALLCEKDDLETFVKHLQLLVENPDLRNDMSKKGEAFVLQKFAYTRLVEDMRDYYNFLLKVKAAK